MNEMNLPIVTVVGGILKDEQGRILLTQRPADKAMPFLWEFPGGKVEVGETPEAALARELFEEIDIEVASSHLKPFTFVSLAYPDFHIILLCYHCSVWTGTPSAKEGQGGVEWVTPQDLERYPMRDANYALVPLLQRQAVERLLVNE
jgi:8-oxo-dGTP diphosphatase